MPTPKSMSTWKIPTVTTKTLCKHYEQPCQKTSTIRCLLSGYSSPSVLQYDDQCVPSGERCIHHVGTKNVKLSSELSKLKFIQLGVFKTRNWLLLVNKIESDLHCTRSLELLRLLWSKFTVTVEVKYDQFLFILHKISPKNPKDVVLTLIQSAMWWFGPSSNPNKKAQKQKQTHRSALNKKFFCHLRMQLKNWNKTF